MFFQTTLTVHLLIEQASLRADVPMNKKVLSEESIYPISKLFRAKGVDDAVTPSRLIISKKAVPSPTRCPLGGRRLRSNYNTGSEMKAKVGDELSNVNDSRIAEADGTSSRQSDTMNGPSEQVKAYMARIPDLSYMLSTKLIIPNAK
jgi:hypothetical protein